MAWVATAIVGSSLISAGTSAYAASKSAGAAKDAQATATNESRRQFDLVRGDTAPYRQLGLNASDRLASVYSLGPVAGSTAPNVGTGMAAFTTSPDYQFNLAEGQKAIDRSLVARGKGLSGAGVREGVRYASGMASNEYSNFYNRLANIAGLGQAGVNTSASAGMNTAANIGNAAMNAGNARASAYTMGAQGLNNAAQGGVQNYLLSQYMKPGS